MASGQDKTCQFQAGLKHVRSEKPEPELLTMLQILEPYTFREFVAEVDGEFARGRCLEPSPALFSVPGHSVLELPIYKKMG